MNVKPFNGVNYLKFWIVYLCTCKGCRLDDTNILYGKSRFYECIFLKRFPCKFNLFPRKWSLLHWKFIEIVWIFILIAFPTSFSFSPSYVLHKCTKKYFFCRIVAIIEYYANHFQLCKRPISTFRTVIFSDFCSNRDILQVK